MQRPVLLISCVLSLSLLKAQDNRIAGMSGILSPKTVTHYHQLGELRLPIKAIQYGPRKSPTFINLHDDETTSVMASKQLLETKGGLLIRIENANRRNIRFRLDGRIYTFDPNRIFSRQGIIQSLQTFGNSSPRAIAAIEKLAARILQLMPTEPACVIALHNNSDGQFSINSFFPGQPRERDARLVHSDDGQDEDDLFLTTDSLLYEDLSRDNFNIVWQDNSQAKKDGSLSVYCGERKIRYLNCETEHGKYRQYEAMVLAAGAYLYHPRKEMDAPTLPLSLRPIQEKLVIQVPASREDKDHFANNPFREEMDANTKFFEILPLKPIHASLCIIRSFSGTRRIESRHSSGELN